MTLFPEDPRSYLRQEYEQRHKRNPAYSWRSFARDLKLSPSMLSEFLKGRYGLSKGKATNIAQTIRLDAANTEHFIDLLEAGFHRLPSQRELARMRAEERLAKASSRFPADSLQRAMNWANFATLEILGVEKGSHPRESGWLAPFRRLADQTSHALARLLDLGLIQQEGQSYQTREDVTIANEQVGEEDTLDLHRQVLDLSRLAVEGLPGDQRESISVFASIRSQDLGELRKEINDSFLQILNKYSTPTDADTVVCFGLHGFPVYRK